MHPAVAALPLLPGAAAGVDQGRAVILGGGDPGIEVALHALAQGFYLGGGGGVTHLSE